MALMHPKESWVSRWNKFTRLVPGNYAIQFQDELNEDNPEDYYEDEGDEYEDDM